MICFDDVIQVLRCAVSGVFGQLSVTLEPLDRFGYEGSLSVVIDVGGQSRMVVVALLRKRCAAAMFRRSKSMNSISRPCLSTARNRYFHRPPTLT